MPKRSEGHLGSFIRAERELYCFAVIFDKCYCLLQVMSNETAGFNITIAVGNHITLCAAKNMTA